jgi:serine/threonine protein phosphatase 1
MMRTLAISDIHGCLEAFDRLLGLTGYNPDRDRLILLGDYVDRGPQSREVVDRVMSLVRDHGAIALRGNHDQRLVDLVRTGSEQVIRKFLEHGGRAAAMSYLGLSGSAQRVDMDTVISARTHITEHFMHHIEFLERLPLYYEDGRHIFVHAGLDPANPDWKRQPESVFMTIKESFYKHPTAEDRTVVFGHTKTVDIHGSADVWFGDGKIGIDGGCSAGLQLNALEIGADGSYRTYRIAAN